MPSTDLAAWVGKQIARRETLAHHMEDLWGLAMMMTFRDPESQAFYAAISPAATLRRCAAERALLDDLLAERHDVCEGDPWYSCAAATAERDGGDCLDDRRRGKACDCGRDARVTRRLQVLASADAEADGYREEWRPQPGR